MQKGIITRLVSHKILYNLKIKNANFDEIFNFYITKYSLSLRDRKLVNNIVLNSMRYNTLIDEIITREWDDSISLAELVIDFGIRNKKIINKYNIWPRKDNHTTQAPRSWSLQGSNDNIDWTILDERENITNFKEYKKFRKNWIVVWLLGQDSNLRPID